MKKIIIDIRDDVFYNSNHIPDAINICKELLELAPERYLNKNDIYYLYCDRGILSLELSVFLNKKGYKTYSIPGGFKKWKEENLK